MSERPMPYTATLTVSDATFKIDVTMRTSPVLETGPAYFLTTVKEITKHGEDHCFSFPREIDPLGRTLPSELIKEAIGKIMDYYA